MPVPSFVAGEELSLTERRGEALAQSVGAQSVDELRAKPAEEILKAASRVRTAAGAPAFGPNVDRWVLPDTVGHIFAKGQQNDVPLLLGSTAGDGEAMGPPALSVADFRRLLSLFAPQSDSLVSLYPAATDDEARTSLSAFMTDGLAMEMRTWARLAKKTGKSQVYLYRFERVAPGRPVSMRGSRFRVRCTSSTMLNDRPGRSRKPTGSSQT